MAAQTVNVTVYEADEEDRERLREPRGKVVEGEELVEELENRDYSKIIAVGDRVSHDIEKSDIQADITIVDGKTQRENFTEGANEIEAERTFEAENPPGKITEEAWKAVRKASALKCKAEVVIDGEEDLLGLPAVLFAPENSVVVYGLWDQGAVLMEVCEENREFSREILGLERSEHMIVGGSWDFFHSGHRYMLLAAIERSDRIDVGVSSNEMLREKLGGEPENSFRERKKNVEAFLERHGVEEFRTIELNGIYGNAVEEGESLLVTPETEKNGRKINSKRRELGREELELYWLEKLEAEDGEIISSTRIRNREINENGLTR